MNSFSRRRLLLVALVSFCACCSKPNAVLVDLETFTDDNAAVVVEVDYDVKRKNNVVEREFKIDLEKGRPGDVLVVSIDGVTLGEMTVDENGDGEFEIGDDPNDPPLPEDFAEPKVGSVVKIGNVFEGAFKEKPPKPEESAPEPAPQ